MSVVHGIAWGLIDEDTVAKNFRFWRIQVREELRTHRIRLIGTHHGYYRVERKTKKGGHPKYLRVGAGNFIEACKLASKLITPSNQETT